MGFRFRRSVKLMPGVRLNFSTRGISTSLGGRGATVNISRRGARATVGMPGTGLSYSTQLSGAGQPASQATAPGAPLASWIVIGIVVLLIGSCLARSPGPSAQPLAPVAPVLPSKTVAGDIVNCRAAPSTSAPVADRFTKGTVVNTLGGSAGWTKVSHVGGDCWIADTLLTE